MPGPTRFRSQEVLKKALKDNSIAMSTLDTRVHAVLKLLQRTGKLSDRRESFKEQAIDRLEHRNLIRDAGSQGLVLLKNERKTLPIDVTSVKKIALLGPLAKYTAAHGGGSASLNAHYKISPSQAFVDRIGGKVELTYSKGNALSRTCS
jgi:beta-glucosidase